MRQIICVAALLVAVFAPLTAFGQTPPQQKKMSFLRVPDSLKDTETYIGKILLERLKVNSSLQMRKNNPDDLVLRARFNADDEKNIPAIIALVDTRLLNRGKDGKPNSQVISIASFADIKAKKDKLEDILVWANKLNSQTIPLRVYLSGDNIVIGRNLFNSNSAPLSENAVIVSFTSIIRAWPGVLADLKKNDFIE